jgi:hypothetical protein
LAYVINQTPDLATNAVRGRNLLKELRVSGDVVVSDRNAKLDLRTDADGIDRMTIAQQYRGATGFHPPNEIG